MFLEALTGLLMAYDSFSPKIEAKVKEISPIIKDVASVVYEKQKEERIKEFNLNDIDFYERINFKNISIKDRVKKYNKQHKINLSEEDYAYLVLTHYGEGESNLTSIIDRWSLGKEYESLRKCFRIDSAPDKIDVKDIVLAPQQYSLYNDGKFEKQVELTLKKDNLATFYLHGENYKSDLYDELLKNYCLKGDTIPHKKIYSLKDQVKLRANKLWKSINYVERKLARAITDPEYQPCGIPVTHYVNEKIATDKSWKEGSRLVWGYNAHKTGNVGKHTCFVPKANRPGYSYNLTESRKKWAKSLKQKQNYVSN